MSRLGHTDRLLDVNLEKDMNYISTSAIEVLTERCVGATTLNVSKLGGCISKDAEV